MPKGIFLGNLTVYFNICKPTKLWEKYFVFLPKNTTGTGGIIAILLSKNNLIYRLLNGNPRPGGTPQTRLEI